MRRPFLRVVLDPALVERLLPRGSFYRFLAENIGKLATEDVVGGLFTDRKGRPSALPPEHYLALILLRYHDNVSYEVAAEKGQFDARWKAVLGKEPMNMTPTVSAASLHQFEDSLKRKGRHDVLLRRTLEMAREVGILARHVTAAQDSTSITGRGAVKDTYNLLGDGVRRLIRALAKDQGMMPMAFAEQYGMGELFRRSTKATANIDWSSPDARRGFLRRLVETAEALIGDATRICAGRSDTAIDSAITILQKVIEQDVQRERDGSVSVRRGVAPDRLISIHDPEMRRGHKSQSEPFEGYKGHYTVDVRGGIVMATVVTGANVHDAIPSASMAADAERASGCVIIKLIGDGAYGTEANRVLHSAAGRVLVAKLPRARKADRYTKADFRIDLQNNTITCPTGKTTTRYTTIRKRREPGEDQAQVGTMRRFSFDSSECGACERRSQCITTSERQRRVDVGDNEHLFQAARKYAEDPQYVADRRERQVAERTVARFVQLGARQARERGQNKVGAQITLIAVVANLTRMLRIARDRTEPVTSTHSQMEASA